jgi:16S rRNA (guanine527-N7)-methyltransferase
LLKKTAAEGNQHPGLICLKGGDLAAEISDSGCKPRVVEIYDIFKEEFFRDKYMLYVRG